MKEELFQKQRAQEWQAIEARIGMLGRRPPRAFTASDLYQFGLMYRRLAADLSLAQSRGYSEGLRSNLQKLVAQGQPVLYGARPNDHWHSLCRFYTHIFPSEVRRSWRPLLVATGFLVAAATFAYLLVAQNQENALLFVSSEDIENIHRSFHDSIGLISAEQRLGAVLNIIDNNLHIAAFAFAGGITLGLLTAYLLYFNGALLGAFAEMSGQAGLGPDFWATLGSQDVLKVAAMTLSGAAGFVLAGGALFPGRLRRFDALVKAGQRAGIFIVGVFSMVLIAGCIEGVLTPLRLSIAARSGMGMIMGVLMLLYFSLAGRQQSSILRR